jgi:uncharacterized protein YqgV (UPF0045/DUF77 family)
MKTTVEISYYPLNREYISPIESFIENLHKHSNIKIRKNTMSTQISGEYRDIMHVLTEEVEKSFKEPHSVFVMKFVNMDLIT